MVYDRVQYHGLLIFPIWYFKVFHVHVHFFIKKKNPTIGVQKVDEIGLLSVDIVSKRPYRLQFNFRAIGMEAEQSTGFK